MKIRYSRSVGWLLVGLLGSLAGCNKPDAPSPNTNAVVEKGSSTADGPAVNEGLDKAVASIANLTLKRGSKGEVVELDCRDCGVEWVEHADEFAKTFNAVRSIRVQDNVAVEKIKQFPSVRSVYLYRSRITDEGVKHLGDCIDLRVVNLIQCGVTDEGCDFLAKLVNLKEFGCYGTPISSNGLLKLARPESITKLNLRASAITDDGLTELLKKCDSLESLELSENTAITDKCVPSIVALPKLFDVNFWLTKITDEGVAQFDGKPLKRLNLDNIPELTNKSVESAAKIKTLEFLHLGKTGVTDEALDQLTTLPNLTELHLTQSKVTAEGVAKLRSAMPKVKIVFGDQ